MRPFLTRWLCTTIAVAIAVHLTGISYGNNFAALAGAALLLGIVNALVRPILLLLSLPFIVLTLGFSILVLNALLFWFVAKVTGLVVHGFGEAFLAALIVSIVNWALSSFFKASDGHYYPITHHTRIEGREKQVEGRVVE